MSIAWVIAWRTRLVGQHLVGVVHAEGELAVGRPVRDDVVGVVLELLDEVRVDPHVEVDVAIEQGVGGGVRVGEVLERDGGNRRRLAPVVVIAHEGDRRTLVPLVEDEWPSAVGRVLETRCAFVEHCAGALGQMERQVVVRFGELDHDRGVVGRLDRLDPRQSGSLVATALLLDGPGHVAGRQRIAVVECHAFLQGQRVREAVLGDLQLGEAGGDLALRGRLDERLVDVAEEQLIEGRSSLGDDVQIGRLDDEAGDDLGVGIACGDRRRRRRRGDCADRQRRGGREQQPPPE